MEINGEGIRVADEVALTGLDFSNLLTENEVVFVAGTTQIEGLPLRVEFPSDGNSPPLDHPRGLSITTVLGH